MRLPVEILSAITKHLDTRAILKCRLVCKEWRCFIDEFCLDELVLFVNSYPTLELWKSTSKPIDFKRTLSFTSDRCLSDDRFRLLFKNVEKLFLFIRNEEETSYRIGKSEWGPLKEFWRIRSFKFKGFLLNESKESSQSFNWVLFLQISRGSNSWRSQGTMQVTIIIMISG